VQGDVLGFLDHAHSAPAKLLDDAEVRNVAANQRGRIRHRAHMLGCSPSQVNEHSLPAIQRTTTRHVNNPPQCPRRHKAA
jgi:hypothetical protein